MRKTAANTRPNNTSQLLYGGEDIDRQSTVKIERPLSLVSDPIAYPEKP